MNMHADEKRTGYDPGSNPRLSATKLHGSGIYPDSFFYARMHFRVHPPKADVLALSPLF